MSKTQITILYKRTLEDGKVVYKNNSVNRLQASASWNTWLFWFAFDKYISVIEIVNPCTACGWLDGIPTHGIGVHVCVIFHWIISKFTNLLQLALWSYGEMMEQTGENGFSCRWAAPPALMRALALKYWEENCPWLGGLHLFLKFLEISRFAIKASGCIAGFRWSQEVAQIVEIDR
jgi:hypothetical protein